MCSHWQLLFLLTLGGCWERLHDDTGSEPTRCETRLRNFACLCFYRPVSDPSLFVLHQGITRQLLPGKKRKLTKRLQPTWADKIKTASTVMTCSGSDVIRDMPTTRSMPNAAFENPFGQSSQNSFNAASCPMMNVLPRPKTPERP
ncbi:hypothetical protein IWX50DRAFT_449890 [Phyllosticta citricarpa]